MPKNESDRQDGQTRLPLRPLPVGLPERGSARSVPPLFQVPQPPPSQFHQCACTRSTRSSLLRAERRARLVALTEHLHKEVDGLQVRQLVVVRIDAHAEEEAGVPPVDDFVIPELDEVGLCTRASESTRQARTARAHLVLLVARRNQPVHLALEARLLIVVVWHVELRQPLRRCVSDRGPRRERADDAPTCPAGSARG